MAKNTALCSGSGDEEDYIDMEIITSSPKNREFEFQMTSTCNDNETATSTADELFYNGKLLPLHASAARLGFTNQPFGGDQYFKMPFTTPCTNTNTPLDSCNISPAESSCNISPAESCRVSCELNPDDYFFQWSTELTQLNGFISNHPTKKPWSKKLKLIKHSILGQKLKASRAYLISLFTKSAEGETDEILPEVSKKIPFSYPTIGAIMKSSDNEGTIDENVQRRSFSGAIKRHSPIKCLSNSSLSDVSSSSSSSSFSFNSNNSSRELRRSSSATEIEGSIEAAIAHCKKSQQVFDSRNLKEHEMSM